MALLTLPRTVNIVNTRLKLLYWLLFLVVLVFTSTNFIVGRQYLSPQALQPSIAFEVWSNARAREDVKQDIEASIRNSDFCLSPERYDYWWDADGLWRYENFTCLPMCPKGLHHWDCNLMSEFSQKISMDNIMLVTAVRETFSQTTTSQKPIPDSRNYWVMSARNSSIGITYSYEVQDQSPLSLALGQLQFLFGLSSSTTLLRGTSVGGEGTRPLRTIILDAKGQLWRAVLPGPSITLSMSDLLELIGEEALLDNPNRYATPNQLKQEGGMKNNPAVQLTGAKLQLEIGCYNIRNPDLEGVELPEEVGDLDQSSMCTLKVRRLPIAWATYVREDYIEGGLLSRWVSGIDISLSSSGKFEYMDVSQLFISLMACMVALGIPSKVLLFISLNCLGQLSKMYKRVLVHDFDISEQVAGAAARLSLCSVSYEAFGDHVSTNGISLAQFRERLQLVLEGDPRLSKEEIATMADFCFGRALPRIQRCSSTPGTLGIKRGMKKLAKKMGLESLDAELGIKHKPSSEHGDRFLGLEDFCSAYSSAEPIDLTDMAIYFDRDRKVSYFERAFTPAKFWKAIHHAHDRSEAAKDPSVLGASQATDGGQPMVSSWSLRSAAEDVQALTASLSNALDRLSATELRLAESERRSSELGSAVGQMHKRLQQLEGRTESGAEIQAETAVCDDIHPAVATDSKQMEQRLRDIEYMVLSAAGSVGTTTISDALTARVAMLERRMAFAAADLFDIVHARRSSGLTTTFSRESHSRPPMQDGEEIRELANTDHASVPRGPESSSVGFDDAMGTEVAKGNADEVTVITTGTEVSKGNADEVTVITTQTDNDPDIPHAQGLARTTRDHGLNGLES